jgi:S-DNA-T family DNA segregation ATPase FtsK/SpoIIIE
MLDAGAKHVSRLLGLAEETVREVLAIIISTFGVLVFLSLVSESADGNLIGRLGSAMHACLTFFLGRYVALVVPFLILGWGIAIWRGYAVEKTPVRVLGMFLTVASICAMIAVPYAEADFSKEDGFRAGGAIGNFLVHQQALALKSVLGVTGCYLFFACVLLVSLVLLTDAKIIPLAVRGLRLFRYIHPRYWAGYLAVWRYWPQSDGDEAEAEASAVMASAPASAVGGNPPRWRNPEGRLRLADDAPIRPAPAQPAVHTRVSAPPPVEEEILDAMETEQQEPARPAPPKAPTQSMVILDDDLLATPDTAEQGTLPLFAEYKLPPASLLNDPPRAEYRMTHEEEMAASEVLERTLAEFGISAQVTQITQGPAVTRFELQPAAGVKVARIAALENDIAMAMRAETVRIIAPIPGRGAVGIEVPNPKPTPVFLSEILQTDAFRNQPSPLAFALGKTISGEPYICDLARMPHLLIAGTTGSGKSVCLNSIIVSILFRMEPDKVKFIMIDPKRVELNVYRNIPHLLAPVVCDPRQAAKALEWAIEQMEERYKRLAELGVRNIDGYNAIVRSHKPHPKAAGRSLEYMPHIVIVIDELADLMLIARNEVEDSIIRLAQMSRAVGMHLIIATQRPSVNVITGIIKANFPCRVAFQVSSKVDSRTILDMNGAEALLGRGDMLFAPAGTGKPIRLQGCFVSDQEVEQVADYVRAQQQPHYLRQDFTQSNEATDLDQPPDLDGIDADESRVPVPADDNGDDDDAFQAPWNRPAPNGSAIRRPATADEAVDDDGIDEALFQDGVRTILTQRKASVSLLQRKLRIGFARAGRLMDMMEDAGIVGPNVGSKVREILVDPEEYLRKMDAESEHRF